jgi:peptidoglycan/xylan/chitin deacetylase (PgdA/CDA1 family)
MKPHVVPRWIQRFFPDRIWEGASEQHQVYLTFDDGPVPGITDFVLEELEKRGQKATFFVVGDNVRKYSQLAQEVVKAGHQLGNHTFNHLHGFKTGIKTYVENVKACDLIVQEKLGISTSLFRPPYGMMGKGQAKEISKEKTIVMWSLLTGDYDRSVSPDRLLRGVKPKTAAGKIIVFHDQEKTLGHLQKILPDYLDFLEDMGFNTGLL